MRRRTVLSAVPALLAGCAGPGSTPDDSATTTRSTAIASTSTRTVPSTTTETVTSTETATSTETTATPRPYDLIPADPATATPADLRERLDARDCTALADLPVTCPGDAGDLAVSLSSRIGRLSSDTLQFTVENRADSQFHWGAYDWRLRKWDGSKWRRIAPLTIPGSLDSIRVGNSYTYQISVDNSVVQEGGTYTADRDVTLAGLGPGVYGFSLDGYFTDAPDQHVAAAAVFGFAGTGPPVRPTDSVQRVERDGSELVVRDVAPSGQRDEFTVSLVEADPEVAVLPEHVLRFLVLRNTLPFAATEGVETIRFVGDTSSADYLRVFGVEPGVPFGFRGYAFETTDVRS